MHLPHNGKEVVLDKVCWPPSLVCLSRGGLVLSPSLGICMYTPHLCQWIRHILLVLTWLSCSALLCTFPLHVLCLSYLRLLHRCSAPLLPGHHLRLNLLKLTEQTVALLTVQFSYLVSSVILYLQLSCIFSYLVSSEVETPLKLHSSLNNL